MPELTFGLLEPLGALAYFKCMLHSSCFNSLGTKSVFQIVFFISQREHCIFIESRSEKNLLE